jgi:hypothetical protein
MAEIKKRRKTRMYEPWGYREENNYQSDENQFDNELNELFASASYNKDDKKIHFFNNDGLDLSGSSIDTNEFASGVIESATYDKETKILTIVFSNGDIVEINLADLIDENEFADGLQVNDGIVSIKLDGESEAYLIVSPSGLKLSGIDAAIEAEKTRAEEAETALQAAIEAEGQRAQEAEEALDAKIEDEIARATSAETGLDTKITQEIVDREADVDAEEARAKAAEETLDAKLDQEIQDRKDDVDAEEDRATAAEAAEKARAEAAEAAANRRIDTLNDALDAEKGIREAADIRLENLITAEKNRAEAAEEALDAKIDQEIADRIADVDAEEARATAAETELETALDVLNQKLGYKDNETLQKNGEHEVAFGSYNISNSGDTPADRTIFSIGNGTADDARSNAFEVRENGDVYMWIENDYMQINRLLAMLAHEVYDDDDNSNNG